MEIDILSLFPHYFKGPFESSILKRAQERKLLQIRLVDIRDFAENRRQVDDRPFGGGPGMVLKPEPLAGAIESVKRPDSYVIYLSPQGPLLTAKRCEELALMPHLIFLCGHYEGVDERIVLHYVDAESSIGDFILPSGCAAAIVHIEAIARFIPGVIGHEEANRQDSFQNGIFDWPHYTRPANFRGWQVPETLLSGHHGEIAGWRRAQAIAKTQKRRPDLIEREEKQWTS
jgi:tRNA (guanine37-N1)-methyltransferase